MVEAVTANHLINNSDVTKVEIPFTEAKPRRAKRWVLLLLPGLLATILLTTASLHVLSAWNSREYSVYSSNSNFESYHFRLNSKNKRLLSNKWGSLALSDSLPQSLESVLREANGTLSLHLVNGQIVAGSYNTKNGLVYFGDSENLERAAKVRLFYPSFYSSISSGDRKLRITPNKLTVWIPSEVFIDSEPLLPAGVQIVSQYNQLSTDSTNPLASSRILLGDFEDKSFFHLTMPQIDRSMVEQVLLNSLSTYSLSTSVETNEYTYRTREVTTELPATLSSQNGSDVIGLYLAEEGSSSTTPVSHAIIGTDKAIITNLPLEQANYVPTSTTSYCLKKAHTYLEQETTTVNSRTTLSEIINSPSAQSERKIRYCF